MSRVIYDDAPGLIPFEERKWVEAFVVRETVGEWVCLRIDEATVSLDGKPTTSLSREQAFVLLRHTEYRSDGNMVWRRLPDGGWIKAGKLTPEVSAHLELLREGAS